MSKLLLLTLNEQEEKVIDKIIAAISDYIRLEPMQITPASVLSFPGREIRQTQCLVFQDWEEVNPVGSWKPIFVVYKRVCQCHIKPGTKLMQPFSK